MPALTIEVDPTSEDAANTPLALVNNSTHYLTVLELPEPPESPVWAESADTEGARLVSNRHGNRAGQRIGIRIHGSSASDVESKVLAISKKVEKIRRVGGTIKFTLPSGNSYVLDPLAGGRYMEFDRRYLVNNRADVVLTFTAKPYFRKAWRQLADNVETTNPEIVFVTSDVKGDVPALARLVIDDDQGVDQWFFMWGRRSRYDSADTTAKLVYPATDFTPLSTSAAAAGATGAFGSSNNVVRNSDLVPAWQAILSTQLVSGSSHLTHIGDYVVWARVYCPTPNAGDVEIALEWAEGDFRRFTRNQTRAIERDWEVSWRLVKLGQIHVSKAAQGSQRWEGRILARSSVVGDEIDINRVWLVPCAEGYGEARALRRSAAPTAFAARDEFTGTTAGNALNGRTAPVGGAWATSGDATDFVFADESWSAETVRRSTTGDVNGRRAILGSTNHTTTEVGVTVRISDSGTTYTNWAGLIARYVDTSNYIYAFLEVGRSGAATSAELNLLAQGTGFGGRAIALSGIALDTAYRLRLVVYPSGLAILTLMTEGGAEIAEIPTFFSAAATGGAIDDGKPGIIDLGNSNGASARSYEDFYVATPAPDAAIFASQSAELRSDSVLREDSAGVVCPPVSHYEGDHLFIDPDGGEGRDNRILVKASRGDPTTMADPAAADDLSARLWVAERFVLLPEA